MSEAIRSVYLPQRISALVASFARIGETTMCGLPFYNDGLVVEAVGFERMGTFSSEADHASLSQTAVNERDAARSPSADWFGALITPWFLNLMLIPDQFIPYTDAASSIKRKLSMPGGTLVLRGGGTDDFGLIYACSIASPVNSFKTQDQARSAAYRALARIYAPPHDNSAPVSQARNGLSRRTLFRFAGRPLNSESPS